MFRRLLVALSIVLFATTAFAVVSYNDRTTTRLWGERGMRCTAFFVEGPSRQKPGFAREEQTWLMTAKHCKGEGVTAGADVFDHKQLVTWKKDFDGDVALGLVTYPDARLLKIAKAFPAEGEPVYIHGYGFGVENIVFGVVRADDEDAPGFKHIEAITGDVWPGNSGSPVLNAQGEVIGLVSALRCRAGLELQCMFGYLQAVDLRYVYVTPISRFAYPAAWPR